MSLSRLEILFGPEALGRLRASRVALFGVGGVGGHCADALARCGVGTIWLVDGDAVAKSNINRQMVALESTQGQPKVEVMKRRILDINPYAQVRAIHAYYQAQPEHSEDSSGGEAAEIWAHPFDLVIDAIDQITAKVDIAFQAQAREISCLSCMGAANKLNPMGFEAVDLYDTSVCPLCRAMRRQARERGITRLRVVYSKEPAAEQKSPAKLEGASRPVPGSFVCVTGAAGLMLANEAVRMLLSDSR